MFKHFNLAAGLLAILLFAYAQQQGWSLFDDVANGGSGRSGGGRIYHK
jgi:uncharacterized membrane protein